MKDSKCLLSLGGAALTLLLIGCGGSHAASTGLAEAVAPRMIGPDKQMAVVNECYFALRSSLGSPANPLQPVAPSDNPISLGGKWTGKYIVSNWDYIDSDAGARGTVAQKVTPANASMSTIFGTSPYGNWAGIGRGGQCFYFVNLILYRSQNNSDKTRRTIYAAYSDLKRKGDAWDAQPGDVVYYYASRSDSHAAICVGRSGDGVDVVDSNYMGYGTSNYLVPNCRNGGDASSSEIIGIHHFTKDQLKAHSYGYMSGYGVWYGPNSH